MNSLKMSNKIIFLLILGFFFRDFRSFLRPCEALRQVKKQQIKEKYWIWDPISVYYVQHDMCPKFFFNSITPP